jgi:hypothetical protein
MNDIEFQLAQQRIQFLESLLAETLEHIRPEAVGHDQVLGLRFDCDCLRCRVAETAPRYHSSGLNATDRRIEEA